MNEGLTANQVSKSGAVGMREDSELTKRINHIQSIRESIRGAGNIADAIGDNLFGTTPKDPLKENDLPGAHNGTIEQLDICLADLDREVGRLHERLERIRNI